MYRTVLRQGFPNLLPRHRPLFMVYTYTLYLYTYIYRLDRRILKSKVRSTDKGLNETKIMPQGSYPQTRGFVYKIVNIHIIYIHDNLSSSSLSPSDAHAIKMEYVARLRLKPRYIHCTAILILCHNI